MMLDYKYKVNPTKEQTKKFAKRALEYNIVAYDIESTGLDPYTKKTLMLQFGLPDGTVYIYTDYLPAELLSIMPKVVVLGQNLKFDVQWSKHNFNMEFGELWDTMIVESVLNMGKRIRVGLGSLAERYLGIDMEKGIRENFIDRDEGVEEIIFTEEEFNYAARDVAALFPIMDKQKQKIADFESQYGIKISNVVKLENETVKVTAEVELNGIGFDQEGWESILNEEREELLKSLKEIYKEIPDAPPLHLGMFIETKDEIEAYESATNIASPHEVVHLLKRLGAKNIDNSDSHVLNTLKSDIKLAGLVLEYRKYSKRVGTYLEPMLDKVHPITQRVHPDYWQLSMWGGSDRSGTESGRYSSNFQQIPADKKLRNKFFAREGYDFVTADYSGVELVIIANLSGDKGLAKAYSYGDIHAAIAAKVFPQYEYEDIAKIMDENGVEQPSKNPNIRDLIKMINYGLAYGLQPRSLSKKSLAMFGIKISEEEAERIFNMYYKEFPDMMRLLESQARFGVKHGFIHDKVFGRVRYFKEEDEEWSRRNKSKNYAIQSLNASQMKLSMCRILEELPECYIVGSVHDEVLVEVPKENSQHYANRVREIMIVAAEEIVPGPVEYNVGIALEPYWTK